MEDITNISENHEKFMSSFNFAMTASNGRAYETFCYCFDILHQELVTFSTEDPSKIAYTRNEKRIRTTFGRYVKRTLLPLVSSLRGNGRPISFNDNDLQIFTDNLFTNTTNIDVSISSGSNIIRAYENCIGSATCMTGSDRASLMELLAYNPETVSIAQILHRARALIWTTDEGVKILDRVYADSTMTKLLLKRWAENNNYLIREDGVHGNVIGNHKVELSYSYKLERYVSFPYLDTFRYGFINSHRKLVELYNSPKCLTKPYNHYVFIKTDGRYKHSCDTCGEGCDQYRRNNEKLCNEHYHVKYFDCCACGRQWNDRSCIIENSNGRTRSYCSECLEQIVNCEYCGNTTHEDNIVVLSTGKQICKSCFSRFGCFCYRCNQMVLKNNCYEIGNRDLFSHSRAFVCEQCGHPCENCSETIIHNTLEGIDATYPYCRRCAKLTEPRRT